MNVFLINGSPKGTRSNTYRLSSAFVEGLGKGRDVTLREADLSKLNIQSCLGCFACWNKTPGKCCMDDNMGQILQNLLWADVTIWSFPLYYFGVPGKLKTMMDRQLPLVMPFMNAESENGGHASRFDMSGKRNVVISTCGFFTAQGNYDGVNAMFDHLCGKNGYTSIYCGQGELFRVKELNQRTGEYLGYVRRAGQEFADGDISRETRELLSQLLYPREAFEAMADASWGVEQTGERTEESLVFTRQMAALYKKASHPGKNLVLEMYYTDVQKRYQVILGKDGSQVLTENFLPATTIIETPYSLWQAIAAGEITGEEALMQGKYRVKGDFSLMLKWDTYFGTQETQPMPEKKTEASSNMNILLFPWIIFWVAASIDGFSGSLASIFASVLVPLLFWRNRKTVYDLLTPVLVTVCAIMLLLGAPARLVVPASYLCFGVMWTVSGFFKLPLTAHYSMNDYGYEAALSNPLFLKTNRILTLCWGVLYLLTPIWTYYIMGSSLAGWTGAINSGLPLLMGIFTAWFQKWYPAKVARGD